MDVSAMETGMAVGQAYANLAKRVLEDSKQSAQAIIEMLPQPPAKALNPPHLGQNIDIFA